MLRLLVGVWIVTSFAGCTRPQANLILATTTSVQSSGLLDVLLPKFGQEHGVEVRVLLAGSGRALEMLSREDADVVISHASEAEARMLASHPDWVYRKLMFNTFVIVGPKNDVAGVRLASSAPEAMRRIAAAGATFLSRGDESGTHERERLLWKLAGAAPDTDRLLVSGAGMSTTLRQASERHAYTLTDKPTFLRFQRSIELVLLFEGGPELLNTYAVIVGDANGERRDRAQAFTTWLLQGNGRTLIKQFKVQGHAAYGLWPEGADQNDPDAIPFAVVP